MASPDAEVRGQLDGRDPNQPNYPPLNWRGVSLYKDWDFGQPWVQRPAGADPGKQPGELWWNVSTLDEITVLSEILTKKYHGATVLHMIAALYAVLIEGQDAADVRKKLGLQ